jgi:hypothetical protein
MSDNVIVIIKFEDDSTLETEKEIIIKSKYISDTLNMTMNENDTTFEMELNKVKPKTMKHIYEFMK